MPRIAPFAGIVRQATTGSALIPRATTSAASSSSSTLMPTTMAVRTISSSFASSSSLLRPALSSLSLLRTITSPLRQLSPSPARQTQVRGLAYGNMYQPSQRKRKRKHGFLVRSKGGRLGRKTLSARRARDRRFLSH